MELNNFSYLRPNANSLASLPEEVLIEIIKYCDHVTITRLQRTCKRLYELIAFNDSLFQCPSRGVIISNMVAPKMKKRCMPHLCLEQDNLYFSKENMIIKCARDSYGNCVLTERVSVIPSQTDDVSKISINEDEVISGGRDGVIRRFRKLNLVEIASIQAHDSDVFTIDINKEILVSGSRDKFVKIWLLSGDNIIHACSINMHVRVLSAIIMSSDSVVIGTPGINNIHQLQMYNIERAEQICELGQGRRHGAGIISLYREDENMLISAGYDTHIKLWDIRTPLKSVSKWTEPYDNAIYCVSSDHHVSIITGSSRNGFINIWDKRKLGIPVATHYSGPPTFNSPIYSLGFDAGHLFVALDKAALQYSYIN